MNSSTQSNNFYIVIKQKLEFFFEQLSTESVITYISCFGIGFLFGWICKKYMKYIVTVFIFIALFLSVMHYFGLILVQVQVMKDLIGMQGISNGQQFIAFVTEMMKLQMIEISSFVLGCLLGFKLG